MKITPGKSVSGPGRAGKTGRRRAAGGGFSIDNSEAPAPAAVSGVAPLTAMNSVLAVQSVDEGGGRRRAIRHGFRLLDHLDDIRLALLNGAMPRDRLENIIQALKTERGTVADPKLVSILDEIELRAAVELAKMDQVG